MSRTRPETVNSFSFEGQFFLFCFFLPTRSDLVIAVVKKTTKSIFLVPDRSCELIALVFCVVSTCFHFLCSGLQFFTKMFQNKKKISF